MTRRLVLRSAAVCLAASLAVSAAGPAAHAQQFPGLEVVDPVTSAQLFSIVCLGSATVQQARGALANFGMRQNPDTGTYFAENANLSVNPEDGVCSILFSFEGSPDFAGQTFYTEVMRVAGDLSNPVEVSADRQPAEDGRFYVFASIVVGW